MSGADRELLAAWRGGDKEAGIRLFERHYDSVACFFRNKVSGSIDDLVQNTFLGCVESLQRFREDSSFRTYLFGIAKHLLYEHYRVSRRDAGRFDVQVMSSADLSPGAGTLIVERQEEELLLLALRHIPVEHQVLLELYYWESQRAQDIAELLGVPEGTVRTRLRRAKQLLAVQLETLAENPALFERTHSGLETWAHGIRAHASEGGPESSSDSEFEAAP
jgi:RNA polymerase sigma-70 factor (ECF subfamily)